MNLTVNILTFLPLSKLIRQISRLSKQAREVIFSSLIWKEIHVNDVYGDFLPNFKTLASFIRDTLVDYQHLHVLNLSNAFITEPNEDHISFFTQTLPKLGPNLIKFFHPRWLPDTKTLTKTMNIYMPRL